MDYTFNENGIPCCPHDPSLPMKREGSKSHLRSNLPTMKFVCPKMKWEYNREDKSKRRFCHCDNPCTTSSCGRIIYVYPEKTLEHTPGLERGSQEWDGTYKIRVNVEKSINHFKDSFCVANRKTTNEKTSCRFTSCWYITVINCSCCRQNPSTTIHQKSKVFHSLGLTNFIKPEAY